jgi:hypothetical protein
LNAQAQLPFSVTPTYDPINEDWSTPSIQLPDGTSIGSTPLELDVTLSQNITLNDVGFGYNYGFGMGGFDPLIQPGDDVFTFSLELLENGTLITPDFAPDIANPFTFGFDADNSFTFAIDNMGTGTSTTALASSLTFDQIDVLVSNSNPGGEAVTSFSVDVGVKPPEAIPDTSSTMLLLTLGVAALLGFDHRKTIFVRSQP